MHLKRSGRLAGNGVAVTMMSNFGLRAAIADAGIELVETKVGDRYLLAALRERGWMLGAEPSGHLIDRNFAPSGDGVAAALLCLEALAGRGRVLVRPSGTEPLVRVMAKAPSPGEAEAVVAVLADAVATCAASS